MASKLAVLMWHMQAKAEDYAWGRPTLLAHKLRMLILAVGAMPKRGPRDAANDYNKPELRQADRAGAEHGEQAYRRIMQHWQRMGRRYQPVGPS